MLIECKFELCISERKSFYLCILICCFIECEWIFSYSFCVLFCLSLSFISRNRITVFNKPILEHIYHPIKIYIYILFSLSWWSKKWCIKLTTLLESFSYIFSSSELSWCWVVVFQCWTIEISSDYGFHRKSTKSFCYICSFFESFSLHYCWQRFLNSFICKCTLRWDMLCINIFCKCCKPKIWYGSDCFSFSWNLIEMNNIMSWDTICRYYDKLIRIIYMNKCISYFTTVHELNSWYDFKSSFWNRYSSIICCNDKSIQCSQFFYLWQPLGYSNSCFCKSLIQRHSTGKFLSCLN